MPLCQLEYDGGTLLTAVRRAASTGIEPALPDRQSGVLAAERQGQATLYLMIGKLSSGNFGVYYNRCLMNFYFLAYTEQDMICKNCQKTFKIHQIVNGQKKNLNGRRYCLECSPFGQHNTRRIHGNKYTMDQFKEAIKTSESVRQVLKKLGLGEWSNNYKMVRAKAKELNLDLSHFKGHGSNKGRTFPSRTVPIQEYLSNARRISSNDLRIRLLKDGIFKYKCYKCDRDTWNGQPISLELEHIDGNRFNNSLDNLTILCPNCHAQTATYRGKNKGKYK